MIAVSAAVHGRGFSPPSALVLRGDELGVVLLCFLGVVGSDASDL